MKTDIQDAVIEEEVDVLGQIQLHRYQYNPSACPQIQFPEGSQLGVLAQELEEIMPGLVRTAIQPPTYSEDGVEELPAVEFKAVNYGALIPYLVSGYQASSQRATDLEAQLTAQNDRLTQLEQRLAECCSRPVDADDRDALGIGMNNLDPSKERALRIQPNPFNERTTVFYELERGGRMQLMANSSDGKQLRVLHEAQMETGSYQYDWNTAGLAPGVYYVTLLVDGQPLVKKAVKVAH